MEPILKNKRALSQETDFSKCVICQANDTTDVLNNLTKRGIGTFKDVLEKRQDQVFERLQGIVHDEDKFLSICHRSYRVLYMMKISSCPYVIEAAEVVTLTRKNWRNVLPREVKM